MMYRAPIASPKDFDSWRTVARPLALAGIPPEEILWAPGEPGAASPPLPILPAAEALVVPRAFVALARDAITHDDPARFGLLYALLLRVIADRALLAGRSDPIVQRVEALAYEARMTRMRAASNSQPAWNALRAEAAHCTRCPLYRDATQTVFGEGPVDARLMLVGEQPGDQEDLQGRPFVGPAGNLLDRALVQAGVERSRVYIANAVKHFKFVPRGRRRIHKKPDTREIEACRWWLDQERALIRPTVTVALGATAAQALLGRAVTISRTRGSPQTLADGSLCHVTVHPSFLLRIPEADRAQDEYQCFVDDLTRAREAAARA